MARADLSTNASTIRRTVTKTPELILKNRFLESSDVLNDRGSSYISRPGLHKWMEVGSGPIRKVFSEPGVFGDDLFVVSDTFLYRVNSLTQVATVLGQLSPTPIGAISMAATAPIGDDIPAYLFIAEGGVLWVYMESGQARGHLDVTGAIANNETVEIGGVYYKFTTGSVDAGTPDGSAGNPWLVNANVTDAVSLQNLYYAINADEGVAGTDYSTATTSHPQVRATSVASGDLYVNAITPGPLGNAITTSETMANAVWEDGATLANGGLEQLRQAQMPDDLGAISVGHINSYVIVIPVQAEDIGTNGRFYWIHPGETSVDPLDYATAERSPDKLHQVIVFSDMFWLMGEKTTEPWVTTGNTAAPMQRYRSILFDRGSLEGTAIQVKDSLIVTDQDGAVFQIKGGLNRISNPQIEERIRLAIQEEQKRNPSG